MDNQHGNSLRIMDEYFESLAYSIGAILGDGSVKAYVYEKENQLMTTRGVRISSMDIDCVERVCVEISDFFGKDYQIHPYTNPNGTQMYRLAIGDELIYSFFHYFIGEKLVLSDEAFRSSRKARIDFIAGLFDTDGYVAMHNNPAGKYGHSWRIGYAARFKTLVEDVARLLQKLGVKVGKVHEQLSGFSRTVYVIKPNIRSFVDAGCYFQIPRKAKKLAAYVDAMKPSETIMPSP